MCSSDLVSKVEEYVPDLPVGTFESVVICYCRYSPINTPLKPLPKIQVSPSLKIEI